MLILIAEMQPIFAFMSNIIQINEHHFIFLKINIYLTISCLSGKKYKTVYIVPQLSRSKFL